MSLYDVNANIYLTEFENNLDLKKKGMNIIQIGGSSNVQVAYSVFDTLNFSDGLKINGTYVKVEKAGEVSLTIKKCDFRTGSSLFGGAIYISQVKNLTFISNDNSFQHNKADMSGGAIFIEKIDNLFAISKDDLFKDNSCRYNGDNLYVDKAEGFFTLDGMQVKTPDASN